MAGFGEGYRSLERQELVVSRLSAFGRDREEADIALVARIRPLEERQVSAHEIAMRTFTRREGRDIERRPQRLFRTTMQPQSPRS